MYIIFRMEKASLTKIITAKVDGLFLSVLLSKCHRADGLSAVWLLLGKSLCTRPLFIMLMNDHLYLHLVTLKHSNISF